MCSLFQLLAKMKLIKSFYVSNLLIVFLFTLSANAQEFNLNFIPKGYEILHYKKGNLNLDTYDDYIVILKKKDEEYTSDVVKHPEKRPLYILLGQPNKSFKVVAKNDNCVYCIDCGGIMGDPFVGVTIKDGYFSVEHYGGSSWRWTRIITFKYSKSDKDWFLYKDGADSFHASEPEKIETTIKTKKDFGVIPFKKYDIYKE